jgi:hypothetical protein
MRVKNLVLTAGALVLGFAAFTAVTAVAQGPLYDRVIVNLPYTVTIGDRTLAPGEYVIQQNRSEGGGQRVLLIYSDQGMKFETSAMTIPTLDNRTPEDTKVVLHHYGPDYYFDKIWIQGKNYGYEFPLPDSVKARQRERMEPMNVAARYEATPAESTNTQAQTATTQQTTTATTTQNQTANQTPPASASNDTNATASAANNQTATATDTTAATPTNQTDTTANRAQQDNTATSSANANAATPAMPATAANWLFMLFGGGALSGAGLAVRRYIR